MYLSSCMRKKPFVFWRHRVKVKVAWGTTWKHKMCSKLLYDWPNPRQVFMMETSNEDTLHITRVFDFTYFSRSQRSNLKCLRSVPTPIIGWIFTKFLSWMHLIRIHHIHVLHGFLIWPTFEGQGGQTLKFIRSAPNTLTIWQIFTNFLSWIHLIRIHHIHELPGWFDLLFKVTVVKLWNCYRLLQHRNYWADLRQIFIMDTNVHHILNGFLIWPTIQDHTVKTNMFYVPMETGPILVQCLSPFPMGS
jgi:hypothetical protein